MITPLRKFSALLVVVFLLLAGCRTQPSDYQSDVMVTEPTVSVDVTAAPSELPSEVNLDVPFYSQAPTGDWSMPYQEACEEASLLQAYYYVTEQSVSLEVFEAHELAMVDWEIEHFGQFEHTSIEQTAEMARLFLGYRGVEVVENPTVEDLKGYLAQGYPIVAPFAGRHLGNPFYSGEGPVYHMLVIRGYDETHFITNDVGTRNGENFVYSYDVLMNALHDWHEDALLYDEGILNGAKAVMVVR